MLEFVSFLLSLLLLQPVLGYRPVIHPKEKETTSEEPKPWIRTVYSTKVEIVTPTVIAGVTFSGKPLATPDPLQPWVSLQKDGRPKTIKPEIKNGHTRKGRPDYSTYFKTATIHKYTYDELKAHNMDPNDVYEEEVWLDEDDTYVSLNPVIRCTPNRYVNKKQDIVEGPFCTPKENSRFKVGSTYFVTWFTKFFEEPTTGKVADKVRLHISYVKEKAREKGYHRRALPATFYTSEWFHNVDGLYAIEPENDWLGKEYERRVVISIQPDYIPDDEFDPLEHGVLLYLIKGTKVAKKTKDELRLEDAGISDDTWYYVALTIPTLVVVALVFMYFFLYLNKGNRDFSDITMQEMKKKHRVLGKISDMKGFKKFKNHKYSELPTFQKTDKQS